MIHPRTEITVTTDWMDKRAKFVERGDSILTWVNQQCVLGQVTGTLQSTAGGLWHLVYGLERSLRNELFLSGRMRILVERDGAPTWINVSDVVPRDVGYKHVGGVMTTRIHTAELVTPDTNPAQYAKAAGDTESEIPMVRLILEDEQPFFANDLLIRNPEF